MNLRFKVSESDIPSETEIARGFSDNDVFGPNFQSLLHPLFRSGIAQGNGKVPRGDLPITVIVGNRQFSVGVSAEAPDDEWQGKRWRGLYVVDTCSDKPMNRPIHRTTVEENQCRWLALRSDQLIGFGHP